MALTRRLASVSALSSDVLRLPLTFGFGFGLGTALLLAFALAPAAFGSDDAGGAGEDEDEDDEHDEDDIANKTYKMKALHLKPACTQQAGRETEV